MRHFLFGKPTFAAGRLQQDSFADARGLAGGDEAKCRADAAEIVHLAVRGIDGGGDLAALARERGQGGIDLGDPAGEFGGKALAHAGKPLREFIASHAPSSLRMDEGLHGEVKNFWR